MESKSIAVITGASSGLGRVFAREVCHVLALDEIWLVARRREKLEETASQIETSSQVLALDITKDSDLEILAEKLESEKPDVRCLVNSAGMGRISEIREQPVSEITGMIDLNCRALAVITSMCLPYMKSGAWILELASIAAFQPMPGFVVYAASKSFVERYSKGLHAELKKSGIHVTCVCPYWVDDTEFIGLASGEKSDYRYKPLSTRAEAVVCKALRDVRHNRMLSTAGVMSCMERVLSKVLPDGFIMAVLNRFRRIG